MDTEHGSDADLTLPANYREFLTPLGNMESDELWEAAKNVETLLEHPGWAVLTRLVGQVEKRETDILVRRTVAHVEYAAQAGTVRGLRVAKDAAATVLLVAQQREKAEREYAEAEKAAQEEQNV